MLPGLGNHFIKFEISSYNWRPNLIRTSEFEYWLAHRWSQLNLVISHSNILGFSIDLV